MTLLDFVKMATLDGKIPYVRINKNNVIMVSDSTNSLLVHAQSKVPFGLKQDLLIGDTKHFLKVLTLLGVEVSLEIEGTAIVLSNKTMKFTIELLSNCPNYVADGTNSLNKLLSKVQIAINIENKGSQLSDVIGLYEKPIISIFPEGNNLFAGIADLAFANKVKQFASIQISGTSAKKAIKSPFDFEDATWYNGLMLLDVLKILNGMENISFKLSLQEKSALMIIGKSREATLYFCLVPTSIVDK